MLKDSRSALPQPWCSGRSRTAWQTADESQVVMEKVWEQVSLQSERQSDRWAPDLLTSIYCHFWHNLYSRSVKKDHDCFWFLSGMAGLKVLDRIQTEMIQAITKLISPAGVASLFRTLSCTDTYFCKTDLGRQYYCLKTRKRGQREDRKALGRSWHWGLQQNPCRTQLSPAAGTFWFYPGRRILTHHYHSAWCGASKM